MGCVSTVLQPTVSVEIKEQASFLELTAFKTPLTEKLRLIKKVDPRPLFCGHSQASDNSGYLQFSLSLSLLSVSSMEEMDYIMIEICYCSALF